MSSSARTISFSSAWWKRRTASGHYTLSSTTRTCPAFRRNGKNSPDSRATASQSKENRVVLEEKKQLILTLVFTGVCIALTVSFSSIQPVIIFFFLHEIGRGATGPIMDSYTQKCITSSKERATLSSFGSMVGHFGGALGLVVSGLIAKYVGITSTWIVSGTVLVLATLLMVKNHKDKPDRSC